MSQRNARCNIKMHKAIILPVFFVVCLLEYEGKYRIYLKALFLGENLYPRADGQLNNEELRYL
jgi:hypothetical protein